MLNKGTLSIVPKPNTEFITGASVDLRLNQVFMLPIRVKQPYIDPMVSITSDAYLQTITIPFGEKFIIHPNEFILASTYEYVEIPKDLQGHIEGRSSLARLGIVVHATAGKVDPGFKGRLIFELSNHGTVPISLYPLMRIASLEFYKVIGKVLRPYKGKYLAQPSTRGTKIFEDSDLSKIDGIRRQLDLEKVRALESVWGEDRTERTWLTEFGLPSERKSA